MRILNIMKEAYILNLKRSFSNRMELFTKLFGYPARLFMIYFLWISILDNKAFSGVEKSYVLGYYTVSLFLIQMYPFIRKSREIREKIFSGEIVNYLSRNIPFGVVNLMEYASTVTVYFLFVAPIAYILLGLVTRVFPDFLTLILFLILAFLGSILRFLIWYVIGLISFYTHENIGIITFYLTLENILSGALLPLNLFPQQFQTIFGLLPFRLMLYTPVNFLFDRATFLDFFNVLFLQLFWLIVVFGISEFVWKNGLKRFTAFGI
ncbi:ABC-2 type transport system permease protein [Thermosipho japonicus]|uniref:ABC-2 type transport system permease protein n=1 Tax=Thermosipho japonicus TaxID=90323 RepID=A0A841GEY9_9BACT|nr:ABC-2 family transporter protein [Thermosipho japonicus]MBB6062132.1 ABC-2 type transport system permease protein [Thermosipho japonicus]